MIDKNPQALALAYKKCKGKKLKIIELKITPGMKTAAIEKLIEICSVAKAAEKGLDISEVVAGQRWYIEGLVVFSGLTTVQQMDIEYEDSFADTASESDMFAALAAI